MNMIDKLKATGQCIYVGTIARIGMGFIKLVDRPICWTDQWITEGIEKLSMDPDELDSGDERMDKILGYKKFVETVNTYQFHAEVYNNGLKVMGIGNEIQEDKEV